MLATSLASALRLHERHTFTTTNTDIGPVGVAVSCVVSLMDAVALCGKQSMHRRAGQTQLSRSRYRKKESLILKDLLNFFVLVKQPIKFDGNRD